MKSEQKNWFRRHWIISSILGFFIFFIFLGVIGSDASTSQVQPQQEQEISLTSTSFNDFQILCDLSATNLQKQDIFEKQFKDQYVEWTGRVSSISESFGSYSLQVIHCPSTFISDIHITMEDDQKDVLLQYGEGDLITYRAKLTRLGDILGLSAREGVVIG